MTPLLQPVVLVLVLGVVIGLTVVIVAVLRMGQGRMPKPPVVHARPDRRARRLDSAVASVPGLRRAVELTANLANRRGALGSVERSLRAADVPIRPAEMILAHLCAIGLVPCALFLLTHSLVLTMLGASVVGFGPTLTLKFLVKRRRKRFAVQLPDALTTLAGSLRAGRSIGQAMEALSREISDPTGRELRKVVAATRRGGARPAARAGRRGQAHRQRRLPLGRARDADPIGGRWQPRRAAGSSRGDDARAVADER
jgi:tight adherence protein B